jgi:hypothetical protein
MQDANFDTWVSAAQQKFLSASDLPFIDDDQIDMAQAISASPNLMVDQSPGGGSTPSNIEPMVELFEARLIRSGSALPVRFVILNFYTGSPISGVSFTGSWLAVMRRPN